MIKKIVLLTLSSSALFLAGCASFSYQGAHSNPPEKTLSDARQYKLNQLNFIYDTRSENVQHWAQEAEQEITADLLTKALISAYPDRFSLSEKASPINVTVKFSDPITDEKLGLYIVTLGILPGRMSQDHNINVMVSNNDTALEGWVKLNNVYKMALWTPFAWFGNNSPQVGYNGAHESISTFFETARSTRMTAVRRRILLSELTEEINAVTYRMAINQ